MPPGECVREAWRNVASGTSRALLFAALLGVLLGALSIADAIAVGRLDAQAQAYHSSGAAIRMATAPKAINAAACEALPEVEGIAAAGALREGQPVALRSLGSLTVPAFDVTPGLLGLLDATNADSPGAFVSSTLAARWGVEAGDALSTNQGSLTIAGVFPYTERDGRDSRLANAVLLPTLVTGRFDACLAEVWPSSATRDGLLRATADGTDGKPGGASISLVNESFGRNWEGSADFRARVTRFAPVAAAVLGAVFAVGAALRRRLEFAAALHSGLTHGNLSVIVAAESFVWASAAALGAFAAVAMTGVVLFRATLDAALAAAALTCAAGALAAIAGAITAACTVRENHLFWHFKNRA